MIQDGLYRVFQQSKPSETRRCDPAEVQLEGTCNIMQLVCEQGPVMVPICADGPGVNQTLRPFALYPALLNHSNWLRKRHPQNQ